MSTKEHESPGQHAGPGAAVAATGLAGLPAGPNSPIFAAIRRGKVKPGTAGEFAARVKAGALPAMKRMDGFKAYFLIAGADDTIIAISLFTNRAVAEASTQTLMPWIKENLGPLLASPTEATDGEVIVSGVA